jgi:hypothetical protein
MDDIVNIIKNDVLNRTQFLQLRKILENIKIKIDTINNVRGISEITVEELKFVKRNIPKILNAFYKRK